MESCYYVLVVGVLLVFVENGKISLRFIYPPCM